jgi:hypothetical protein
LLHYTATLNELRFSQDPVALDVLSVQELTRLRQARNSSNLKAPAELYENAALMELGVADTNRILIEVAP